MLLEAISDVIGDVLTASITEKSALLWIPVAIWAIVFLGFSAGFMMAENWIGTSLCIVVAAVFPVLRLIKTAST
jgi:uncharacterized membrane protein